MEPYQHLRHRIMRNESISKQASQNNMNTMSVYPYQNQTPYYNNTTYPKASMNPIHQPSKVNIPTPYVKHADDSDTNYLKQLNSSIVKKLINEVKKEFDTIDYDSSFIYDKYPDKVTLQRMADTILKRAEGFEKQQEVQTSQWHPSSPYFDQGWWAPPGSYTYPNNYWLKYLIETLIFQELIERRRNRCC